MIDITTEQVLPLSKASADYLAASAATGSRYAKVGSRPVGQPAAARVKLESVLIGGRRFTSVEACQRFIDRLNPSAPADPVDSIRTSAGRRKAVEAVDRALAQAGF